MQMTQEEWEQSIVRVGVVASCLLKKDGKYLLVQERQPSAFELWNLPAGHVDKGEELEAAAVREAKEETGFDVRIIKELAIYHETAEKAVKHVFTAEIISGELIKPNDEIMDIQWLTVDQVEDLNKNGKLRKPWVWDVIKKDSQA
jgi:ADP-ribose pyrophosphatase YjhB (NUDIX family)